MEEKESEEDLWLLWGKIINEWDMWSKKRAPQTKVQAKAKLCIAQESIEPTIYEQLLRLYSCAKKVQT